MKLAHQNRDINLLMNNLTEHLCAAEQQCLQHGGKLTEKRKYVLSILLQADKALSAYEIIETYNTECNEKMAPMSAYRILEYLERMHLAHKINLANKFVACAHIGHQQNHHAAQFLFCQQCQKVTEMPMSTNVYQELTNEVEQSGFQLCSEQIELTCLCQACR